VDCQLVPRRYHVDIHLLTGLMATQPFGWSEFYKLAQELLALGEESHLRTAVGRAYYFVFHLARTRLIDNQFVIYPGQDSHKQVWEKYIGSPDPHCIKLGEMGKRLKGKRETADYESHFVRIEKDAPELVATAENFATLLEKLDPRLPSNGGVRR
jgi:uncharacterized protein (UPF0332 family)